MFGQVKNLQVIGTVTSGIPTLRKSPFDTGTNVTSNETQATGGVQGTTADSAGTLAPLTFPTEPIGGGGAMDSDTTAPVEYGSDGGTVVDVASKSDEAAGDSAGVTPWYKSKTVLIGGGVALVGLAAVIVVLARR